MIIISDLEVENFRNIKHAKLEGMRDLNVIIGPNNCGKTSILELISSFSKFATGNYLCQECSRTGKTGLALHLTTGDFYLRKNPGEMKVKLKISLNPSSIERLVPGVLEKQKEIMQKECACKDAKELIQMESMGSYSIQHPFFSFHPPRHN